MDALDVRLRRASQALLLNGPRLALLYAQTVLALVTLRVQAQGIQGTSYSARLVPTFFFFNKTLNAAGKAYIKQNKRGTWGGLRVAQGLPAGQVNLTYSGLMFRSLTVQPGSNAGAVFYAQIVAADRESAQKMEYNLKRYGNFLKPNATEEAQAQQAVAQEVNRIVRQALST